MHLFLRGNTSSTSLLSGFTAFGLALCFAQSAELAQANDAADFVRAIYAKDGAAESGGLPAGKALDLFDSELRAMFEKAARVDRDFAAKNPDENPPFAEFDPFRPVPDAHEKLEIFAASQGTPPYLTTVVADFTYRDKISTPPALYSAQLLYRLKRDGGRFLIKDILVIDPREEVGIASIREQLILTLRTVALEDASK